MDDQAALYNKREEIVAQHRKQYYHNKVQQNRSRFMDMTDLLSQTEKLHNSLIQITNTFQACLNSVDLVPGELNSWKQISHSNDLLLKQKLLAKMSIVLPNSPGWPIDESLDILYSLLCLNPKVQAINSTKFVEWIVDCLQIHPNHVLREEIFILVVDIIGQIFFGIHKYIPRNAGAVLNLLLKYANLYHSCSQLLVRTIKLIDKIFKVIQDIEIWEHKNIQELYWGFGKFVTAILEHTLDTNLLGQLMSPLSNMTVVDEDMFSLTDYLLELGLGETLIRIFFQQRVTARIKHQTIILLYNIVTTGKPRNIMRLCGSGVLQVIKYCLFHEINLDTLQLCLKLVLKLLRFVKETVQGPERMNAYVTIVEAVRDNIAGLLSSSDQYVRQTARQIRDTIINDLHRPGTTSSSMVVQNTL